MRLARYSVFDTTDPDTARAGINRAFSTTNLVTSTRSNGHFRARLNATKLPHLTVAYLHFDAGVHITGDQHDYFAIQLPLAGRCHVRQADDNIVTCRERACIVSPLTPVEIDWPARSPAVLLKLSRATLEETLANSLGRQHLKQRLMFDPIMDIRRGPMRSWTDTVNLLVNDLDQGGALVHRSLAMASIEHLLVEGLLHSQHHNYVDALTTPELTAGETAVRRATELIEANPDHALTTDTLAREVGVSARALQQAFQHARRESPMRYLRTVRLRRVREDLIAARGQPHTRVTPIARRWGFIHMGHLSAAYHKQFGETPSETLRPRRKL